MMRWLDFLFPPRVDEIVLRSVSTDDFLTLVAPRLAPITRPGTVVLLPFHDVLVRSAIHEAKYRGSERAFTLLALTLTEYLRDCDDVGFRKPNMYLIPVPLGKERRKERGFNQIEEVVRRAIRILGEEERIKIVTDILVRTRETSTQVSLARHKREENMRGAFVAARSADPSSTYIIIDDVTTTGATLQATIDALKESGAEHIIPLALAH
ncbi:MAG: phosphoribosyltransferase family protein [bacterium]